MDAVDSIDPMGGQVLSGVEGMAVYALLNRPLPIGFDWFDGFFRGFGLGGIVDFWGHF
jgi:hypothetical protein